MTGLLKHIQRVLLCAPLLMALRLLPAQETPVEGLYRYRLENGLELFVMENDAAPLAYIEIAVRAGALVQEREEAGLFHLYEHMMFKGNSLYADEKAVTQAMNSMGVTNWNGSTAVDYVNYYFTVPSDMTRQGLEFWSAAIRSPKMDEAEFEREKKVVQAEIQAKYSSPSYITYCALLRNLFPESPWQLDSGGTISTIENASVEQLRRIQGKWYVPDNAALFVGGDVEHEKIFALVNEIYGGWQPSAGGVPLPDAHSKAPVSENLYLVYPNPSVLPEMTYVSFYQRGPDTLGDAEDTYAADLWLTLLANPGGRFKSSMMADKALSIPSQEYVSAGYLTQRTSGRISFSLASMGARDPAATAKYAVEQAIPRAAGQMAREKKYFSSSELKLAKKRMATELKLERETAEGFLSSLRFFWTSAGDSYFFDYEKRLSATQKKDIDSFLEKYVLGKAGIAVVQVSPQAYEQNKERFESEGFLLVSQENAYWWNQK